jgi:NDP-sugar pyrophosphorylase family protein
MVVNMRKPINWIIPMAGKGTRTLELGSFKPFIHVGEKTILEWLLISLACHIEVDDRLYFVTTRDFENEYGVSDHIKSILEGMGVLIPHQLIFAEDTPPGPAASVMLSSECLMESAPVIVVNVDQYIQFTIPDTFFVEECGFLPIYAEFGTKSSYVSIEDGRITRVVEKENISNLASGGVYGFSSAELMVRALEKQIQCGVKVKGEDYVGPAYNFIIEDCIPVYPTTILAKFDLGNVKCIDDFKRRIVGSLW